MRRSAASLIVALFILASATMPFGHHSIECHLKSRTHCASCTVATGTRSAQDPMALAVMPLRDEGPVLSGTAVTPRSPSLGHASDRAPPVHI
jgi:hypothetical protein